MIETPSELPSQRVALAPRRDEASAVVDEEMKECVVTRRDRTPQTRLLRPAPLDARQLGCLREKIVVKTQAASDATKNRV